VHALLETAGQRVDVRCSVPWLTAVLEEGMLDDLQVPDPAGSTLSVIIESDGRPFDVSGWEQFMRRAWRHDGQMVVENICSSGFDLLVAMAGPVVEFRFRWRPTPKMRAGRMLRSRFRLLTRAVVLQYPAMWLAGTRGLVPLHAAAFVHDAKSMLLAGPGGVGKSTVLCREIAAGAMAVSDNLCVSDGVTVWGVVEPLRIEGGGGASAPHGRREVALSGRLAQAEPDHVVVLHQRAGAVAEVHECDKYVAGRSLVAGTYMAGELRRYWPFAATLATGTDLGPPHAPISEAVERLVERASCVEVLLPKSTDSTVLDLLTSFVAEERS
jgi:hypothetical protein